MYLPRPVTNGCLNQLSNETQTYSPKFEQTKSMVNNICTQSWKVICQRKYPDNFFHLFTNVTGWYQLESQQLLLTHTWWSDNRLVLTTTCQHYLSAQSESLCWIFYMYCWGLIISLDLAIILWSKFPSRFYVTQFLLYIQLDSLSLALLYTLESRALGVYSSYMTRKEVLFNCLLIRHPCPPHRLYTVGALISSFLILKIAEDLPTCI